MPFSFFLRPIVCSLAVVLGIWLGFPNDLFSLPPLVLLYPAGLALLGLGAGSDRTAFLSGLAAGTAGHALALYWIALPLSKVGGLPLAGAVPCAVLVSALLATQCGLFALFCRRFWQTGSIISGIAMGIAWYLFEYLFARIIGFPWLPLAGALAVWPTLVQCSDTVGAFLCGGLWAACAILAAGSLRTGSKVSLLTSVVLSALLVSWGMTADSVTPSNPLPNDPLSFPVLMVEGNIDQNQKWIEAYQLSTVATYTGLTEKAVQQMRGLSSTSDLGKGIILWPETALPFDLANSRYSQTILDTARHCGMPLLTGTPAAERTKDGKQLIYNRAVLINAAGLPVGSYDKEHLVPFGEYVPAAFNWGFLAALMQEVGAYTAGTRTDPLCTGNLALGPLICYEGIFPWLAQDRTQKGANVLVDISNDGWFGNTPAPRQHLYLTALRALEQNRWLLRGTNTGISAITDSRGRIVFHGPQFRSEALWARARLETTPSLYHRISPFIPPICTLLLALLLWRQYRKNTEHAANE